jgi:cytochrome P450
MTMHTLRVPPGPDAPYNPEDDLFYWMGENFALYGDIYKASIYGSDVYVVSAPEYCERILRFNWKNYARKGLVVKRIALGLGNSLITSNGGSWVKQRRMVQTAFTRSSILELANMVADINKEVLAKWLHAAEIGSRVNVTKDLSRMVLKTTLISIFGEDYEIAAPFFSVFSEEPARNLEFAQELRLLERLVLQIGAQRRREGRKSTDSLGRLMQARDRDSGKPMSDAQLAREILTLVVAGHETTASALNWMWYLLAIHPEVQTRLVDEFNLIPWHNIPSAETFPRYAYTRRVIDEVLRLYPPLWLMTRKALKDDELGEFFVPAGTEIYISPFLIQHNPYLWAVPDRFDPDRMEPDNAQDRHELASCPFGAGPRNCIGEFFARVEMQMHLMMFSDKLWLRYDGKGAPEISTGVNLLSKHDLFMLPEIRKNTSIVRGHATTPLREANLL